jgi:hypothetical protein
MRMALTGEIFCDMGKDATVTLLRGIATAVTLHLNVPGAFATR